MPRLLKDGDTLAAIALLALGTMILLQSAPWAFYSPDGPGPAMFPRIYGIAILGLSVALFYLRIRALNKADGEREAGTIDWNGTRRALVSFAAFALSVAAMAFIGFTLAFALFAFFLVVTVFRKSVLTAALTAIGLAAMFYATFRLVLGVELPTGLVGF